MCDIKEKTQLKTMTVYKAVYRNDKDEYLSPFAETPVEIGKVPNFTREVLCGMFQDILHPMRGHISGCLKKAHAIIISKASCFDNWQNNMKIVKIKLGGDILKGSTSGILDENELTSNGIIYAGSEILSIEEVNI